jgi:hypothetical protein
MTDDRTLIQRYATAVVSGMVQKVESLSGMTHQLTKGELRELFVNSVLRHFLTQQFSITSGIIVNQKGDESHQHDIIIYDNRKLPPFIQESNISVLPIEAVLAVIEVKTRLDAHAILKTEKNFKRLREVICDKEKTVFPERLKSNYTPLLAIIGFYGSGPKVLSCSQPVAKKWLDANVSHLFSICLVKKFSWLRVPNWRVSAHVPITYEETKRFLAVLIDNIRTLSNKDPYRLSDVHEDWLSIYLRDQEIVREQFRRKESP